MKNLMSIILLCFNKWNFTKSALKDLAFLDPELHEIIVVDNGSTDETPDEMLKLIKKYKNIKYVRLENNEGFAKGTGKGYRISKGNIVLFLNNDIRVVDSYAVWTDSIFETLEENSNIIISPNGGYVDPENNFKFSYETNLIDKKINYLSGWCLAAHKATFDKLVLNENNGPFSEEFFAYFEDTDLGFRAKKMGIQFGLINVPVSHFGKITSKQLNTNKLYNESRNIFIKKWLNK